ncbi:aspartyl protease family protein [Verrucomicrobium sp. BvORR034]|uniref:aspartyl protease family protein n=1 Tax=Verrucomicrobium sp. BvORR034 TaxID=1396418 RepID=UPI000ABCABAB|nr:aspartyl protease family protein [Verrucomicrobium sp. BvORR034]
MRIQAFLSWLCFLTGSLFGAEGRTLYPVLTLEGQIGSHPVLMVIDTGVTGVVVDQRLIKDLGLATKGQTHARTPSGALQVTQLEPVDLRAGDLRCREGAVFVASDLTMISAVYGRRIDVVAGMGLLKGKVLILDADRDRFEILAAPPSDGKPDWLNDKMTVCKLTYPGLGSPFVSLNEILGSTMIDCGATHGVFVGSKNYERLSSEARVRPIATYSRPNAMDAKGNRVSVSAWTLKVDFAGLAPIEVIGDLGTPDGDDSSSVGTDLMRHFNWVLDFSRDTASYVPSKAFGSAPRFDISGLAVLRIGNEVVVKREVPLNSPAGELGFRENDVLTHLQGKPMEEWDNLTEVREVLAGSEGPVISLKFRRNGAPGWAQMTLRSADEKRRPLIRAR